MPTFKAVVLKHQQRRDGKFSVSIRMTHNRKSIYLPTGLHAELRQINKKTFEIKDQFILERTNKTIREYESALLSISTNELLSMDVTELKRIVSGRSMSIDYIEYCDKLVESNPPRFKQLKHAISVMRDEMKYDKLYISEITTGFLNRYKEFLDNRNGHVYSTKTKTYIDTKKKMKPSTKRDYIIALHYAFKCIMSEVNTEYTTVIHKDPFVDMDNVLVTSNKKKALDVETIRRLFSIKDLPPIQQTTLDIIHLEFCLCGINTADIVSMKRECFDEKNMRITYNRCKTKDRRKDGALSSIKLEPEAYDLFYKYKAKKGELLFDIPSLKNKATASHNMANYMYNICDRLGISRFSPYSFRHSWATIARNKCGVSKDDIDLCLNHTGQNPEADTYIAADWSRIDAANRKVLDYVFHGEK